MWFEFGGMLLGAASSGSRVFSPNSAKEGEWNDLTPRTQRIVEAILPLLPQPSHDCITVQRKRLGVDLGATRRWKNVFPEIVRIIRSEVGSDAVVEVSDRSHVSTVAWLTELVASL